MKRFSVFLGCLMALLLGSVDAAARQSDTTGTAVYVIEEGDSFYELSARLGMPVDSLLRMNPSFPGWLQAGDEIRIPSTKLARPYVVRAGDTLAKLSRDFSVSVEAIRGLNGMSGTNIQIGQRMMIPGQGVQDHVPIEDLNPKTVTAWTAVVYPDVQIGRMLASGLTYHPDRYAISHPSYRIGTIVMVRSVETGVSTFAVVGDRSTKTGQALIDVSHAIARHLGMATGRVGRIEIRLIDEGS